MDSVDHVESWDFDELNERTRELRAGAAKAAMSATAQALDSGELTLDSPAHDFQRVDGLGFVAGIMSQVAGETVKIVAIEPPQN